MSFDSPVVDWNFLRSVYGWAGIQYQAWIRGTLLVCPGLSQPSVPIPVTLNISPTLEFFVNKEKYFGGDMFSYRRAPTVLYLEPGTQHTLDIRIAHDIRVSGGGIPPTVDIVVEADIAIGGLVVNPGDSIMPDIVGGKLAGAGWGSIPVRNENSVDWIEVLGVMATDAVCARLIVFTLHYTSLEPSLKWGVGRCTTNDSFQRRKTVHVSCRTRTV